MAHLNWSCSTPPDLSSLKTCLELVETSPFSTDTFFLGQLFPPETHSEVDWHNKMASEVSSSKIVIWPLTSQKLPSGWENCESLGRNPFSETSAIRDQASYFPYSPSKPAAQGMAARTLCPTRQIFCGISGPPSTKQTVRSHSCINIWP